jgi:hypothetical protein
MTQEQPCRHEYVRIYQRRLKGLERRLVLTRGYLPTGFKSADFGHLGEGSYCFCSKCRARLYPRRTQAEKIAARLMLSQNKPTGEDLQVVLEELVGEATVIGDVVEDVGAETDTSQTINVEELELAAVDVEDIEADGVKLSSEDDSQEVSDEDA